MLQGKSEFPSSIWLCHIQTRGNKRLMKGRRKGETVKAAAMYYYKTADNEVQLNSLHEIRIWLVFTYMSLKNLYWVKRNCFIFKLF